MTQMEDSTIHHGTIVQGHEIVDSLQHYGVKGMKWGVRRYQPYPKGDEKKGEFIDSKTGALTLKKGAKVTRFVPGEWADRERKAKGRAYASYKDSDVKKYRAITSLNRKNREFTYEVKQHMKSPSAETRVKTFTELVNSNPAFKESMVKGTRSIFSRLNKKHLDRLDNPKSAEKAFLKFSYILALNEDVRDPYFDAIKSKGYSMIMDDSDIAGGIAEAPIIVLDREKSMKLISDKEAKR